MSAVEGYKYNNDRELYTDLLNNNEKAIQYVFYCHFTKLLQYNIIKATKGKITDYCDLIQDLYLYLSKNNWEKLHSYDISLPFVNWFSVVSYRFFLDSVRSKIDSSIKVPISNMENNDFGLSSNQIDVFMMDIKHILKNFKPPRDKQILEAILFKDEPLEQIAKNFEVSIDNLYNIKRRAIARLRKELI